MTAKRYLRQIEKYDTMIRNKQAEMQQWQSIALSIVANCEGERVQSSGSPQRMANASDHSVDLEREIEECKAKRKEIISTIERLDVIEYDLLHKVYVQYLTLKEVAITKGNSESWATTTHGRALKHVQDILDGKGKE